MNKTSKRELSCVVWLADNDMAPPYPDYSATDGFGRAGLVLVRDVEEEEHNTSSERLNTVMPHR